MFIELVAGGFLLGQAIYHRIYDDDSVKVPESELPRTDEGTPVPILFGRYRVRSPILVWRGPAVYIDGRLRMDVLLVLGLGFQYGLVRNRIHAAWASDALMTGTGATVGALTGDGSHETPATVQVIRGGVSVNGQLEFLNGKPTQELVNVGGKTYAGDIMIESGMNENDIPGYRGVLSIALLDLGGDHDGFDHGNGPGMPAYQVEASSFYQEVGAQPLGLFSVIGQDANPVSVIYEILTATLGKLGLPTSMIDLPSFEAAQYTLYTESHGYSRCFLERMSAADMIADVLRQIDGIVFQDHATGLIKIKLVRPDYDPNAIPHITRDNCVKLTGLAMGSRVNLINKVTVKYPNRAKEYAEDSATAQNMANAVGQSGQVAEEVIEYRGCCYSDLAETLAARELAARSRPVLKCRAVVNRSFLRVNPGDAVKLTWGAPDIAGSIMRVARVERGTLEDGAIVLDLISDVNYVWRNRTPLPPDYGGIPTPPPVGLG